MTQRPELTVIPEFATQNLPQKDFKQVYDILKDAFNVKISLDSFAEKRYSWLWKNTILLRKLGTTEIIGIGSLDIRESLTRHCGYASIENVAIRKEYRGRGYGEYLIGLLTAYAKERSCYKVILSCSSKNVDFYEKCGMVQHEISMRKDL